MKHDNRGEDTKFFSFRFQVLGFRVMGLKGYGEVPLNAVAPRGMTVPRSQVIKGRFRSTLSRLAE